LGGACADTVSWSMRSTAVGVHYAEMQDVHTFLCIYIYIYISPIMIINRIHENQNLLSL